MQVNTFHKKLTEPEKELFDDYLKKKLPKFEKLITHFDKDQVKLSVTIEKFSNKDAYKVEMVMDLPKAADKALFASEDSRDLRKAVDFAQDKLMEQVKKAIEKLRQ